MSKSQNMIRLNDLDTLYKNALNTHTDLYPQYKVFSDTPSINKKYGDSENKLENIQAALFDFQNKMETNSISLADGAVRVDDEITALQKENKNLKQKLSSLNGRKEGAQGMYIDSKYLYQQYYLGNLILVGSIIGIGIMYKKNK